MERMLVVFPSLYMLFIYASIGGGDDPVLTFVLIPLSALFLAFIEINAWRLKNA